VGINCCSVYSVGMGSYPKDAGSGYLRPCELNQGSGPGQENIVVVKSVEVSHTLALEVDRRNRWVSNSVEPEFGC